MSTAKWRVLMFDLVCKDSRGFLPGAGAAASWRAEPPAAPTSEAAGASGWPGYSATVPAPEDKRQQKGSKWSS